MTTNKKKFSDAWIELDARDAACIKKLFPNGLPPKFFRLGMYSAEDCIVKYAKRHYKGIYKKDADEKVTNKEVEVITKLLNDWVTPSDDEISIHYEQQHSYGKSSSADALSKINAGKECAWTIEQLQPEIDRRKELYEPREGHAPCQYCQRQNPPENMIEGVVIYRMQKGIGRKTGMYCKDKPCATHDQMSHEG